MSEPESTIADVELAPQYRERLDELIAAAEEVLLWFTGKHHSVACFRRLRAALAPYREAPHA